MRNSLRNRRLYFAAKELVEYSEKPIVQIALDYIYSEQSSFSQTMKQVYDYTPNLNPKAQPVEKVKRKLGFFAYIWYNGIKGKWQEMLATKTEERGQYEMICIEELVPSDHILRKIDAAIDFTHIYDLVGDLYCQITADPESGVFHKG